MPAVRVPLGFLNTEPQHGRSNGVPALRQRNSRPCTSLSLAGGSSISASLASSTTTFPRFEARYLDRKSTRLNSSHGYISYAVFCLKKKKRSTLCILLPINTVQSDAQAVYPQR